MIRFIKKHIRRAWISTMIVLGKTPMLVEIDGTPLTKGMWLRIKESELAADLMLIDSPFLFIRLVEDLRMIDEQARVYGARLMQSGNRERAYIGVNGYIVDEIEPSKIRYYFEPLRDENNIALLECMLNKDLERDRKSKENAERAQKERLSKILNAAYARTKCEKLSWRY